jgi:peptide/nickel transport system ATP-binding protein
MANEPFILCDNLVKIYKVADLEVVALQGLDLQVEQGEMLALVGASGSGKSTLLNVIGGLDEPSAGKISVGGRDLLKINDRERVNYKREVVGFVWQQPARNLLPYLSARENVALPMMLGGRSAAERSKRSLELLELVGLADRADFRPDRLSGGQQQRVALAIALANNPPLLLGDEPTGQVDSETANTIFDALRQINERFGTTIVIVTHDQRVANKVDRVIAIRDGRISTEIRRDRSLEDGTVQEEEWVVMDRAGRLQMPQAYIESLDMRERVKLRLEQDHVSVWPGVSLAVAEQVIDDEVESGVNGGSYWRPPRIGGFQKGTLPTSPDPVPSPAGGRPSAVLVEDLSRHFQMGDEVVHAVDHLSLEIPAGVMAVIKGPSGSGKTTLLNLIAGLDEPTSGNVIVAGRPLAQMNNKEKIELRRREIGFVFQTFGLLPFLSARENIEAPLRLVKAPGNEREQRSAEVLELVGLSERSGHRVYELSGGEQQRIAIARALANRPSLLLADEPTGQLDTATGNAIIALIKRIVAETGVTAVVASHDPKVEEAADVVYMLQDGKLFETRDLRPESSR